MFDNSQVKEINVMKPELRKEGIKFTGMKKNDDKSVSFIFEDKHGAKLEHREFAPKRGENQTEEQYKSNVNLLHSRIAHISRAYLTDEENKAIKGADWDSYVKAVVTALGGPQVPKAKAIDADGKTALKVTLRANKGKYYSALPAVPPFISTTNHHKDFIANPQYDMFEIPVARPDAENSGAAAGGQAASDFSFGAGGNAAQQQADAPDTGFGGGF